MKHQVDLQPPCLKWAKRIYAKLLYSCFSHEALKGFLLEPGNFLSRLLEIFSSSRTRMQIKFPVKIELFASSCAHVYHCLALSHALLVVADSFLLLLIN
mmetsp:Transcript_27377/g.53826  ORF Transcript_27377/g.53826 Transcript_27377/m.53826 type:complete len:99 (+) Transcript_27377:875-1171(+)